MHFLLDGMLGKLVRWLRMIGCEATYMNDSPDRDLLSLAKRDSLVLLTSDEELYRTAISRGIESFLVEGRTEPERLADLAERYRLSLRIDTAVSRCPMCGYIIRETKKQEVKDHVPPTTFKVYRGFWVCTNPACGKIYWKGSHWKRIEQTLERARKILESRRSTGSPKEARPTPKPQRRQGTSSIGTSCHSELPRNKSVYHGSRGTI